MSNYKKLLLLADEEEKIYNCITVIYVVIQ